MKCTIQGSSQKMLTQTVPSREADGLVARRLIDLIPPHVGYSLSSLGLTLLDALVDICRWALDHLREMQAARAESATTAGWPPTPPSSTLTRLRLRRQRRLLGLRVRRPSRQMTSSSLGLAIVVTARRDGLSHVSRGFCRAWGVMRWR